MQLSIIIITLNEEAYLPRLLASIKKQRFDDYEIIVADAGSKDKTIKISKNFGCKVVKGGYPSVGRNNGARAANGDILLFLDADVILPDNFLIKTLAEFRKRKLASATCYSIPISKRFDDAFFVATWNLTIYFTQYFFPLAGGFCIFSTRTAHMRINGFDETIILAEDHDYVSRSSKIGTFRVLHSKRILMSMRRFEKEGRFKLGVKYIYVFLYRIFKGNIRKTIMKYF